MPDQETPKDRRVAIRKTATESGIAAELITLLEEITEDGVINDLEAARLRGWLDANSNESLPAIDFLKTTIEQILADGLVTPEERKALHRAVERVLPPELRERARGKRMASELIAKAREREEKTARREIERAERERNQPVYSANFMVAGVSHEGRGAVVARYLRADHRVYLVREPQNPYDPNAIEIRLEDRYQIGYVPRSDAIDLAPYWMPVSDKGRTARRFSTVGKHRYRSCKPASFGEMLLCPRQSTLLRHRRRSCYHGAVAGVSREQSCSRFAARVSQIRIGNRLRSC